MPNRIGTGFRQGAGLHASLKLRQTYGFLPRNRPVILRPWMY